MCGSGPPTGGPLGTSPTPRSLAAFRKIHAAVVKTQATTPACPISKSRARFSKAGRIFARRIIAAAIARPRATRKRWTHRRVMSDSAASCETGEHHESDTNDMGRFARRCCCLDGDELGGIRAETPERRDVDDRRYRLERF